MGKNVAIFVDVANIFYAAKAAGVDIDYVTLLKAATAGRDFVRAYAYTGLDPDNENQRNFHSFLARHGYKVVSKDIRKYGDGKVKANLDIELVVDMMKTARNLDVAIVVSGDGDFAPAIRAVQEMGVRVEVVSFRGNTSSDLIEVADIFTDITQLAKVERGSSRSGRRVAEEEFDMTGTDIPDKQTEGASERARRQRGRRAAEEGRPRESSWARERREAREAREAAPRETVSREPAVAGGPITVMPGEKLSRAPRPTDGDEAGEADEFLDVVIDEEELIEAAGTEGLEPLGEGDEPRRRRRRGGRGRGRGRGRPEDGLEGVAAGPDDGEPEGAPERAPDRAPERAPRPERPMRDLDEDVPVAPRGPRPTPFGSIWDSQLGVPTAPAAAIGPMPDDDEEEPEIPEYLLAERRRGPQGGQMGGRGRPGQGGRGGRQGAYTAAMERERFGRGGLNRYGEPQGTQGTQGSPGRIQSQPQPQGRPQQPRRDDRPHQAPMRAERMPRSDEPWSEVPPEIEEMLRAQMASRGPRPGDRQQPQRDQGRDRQDQPATAGMEGVAGEAASATSAAPAPATGRGRGRPRRTEEPGLAATTVDAASTADAVTSAAEVPGGEPTTAAPRRGRPPRAAALSTPGSTETATPAATETPAKAPATRGRRPATGAAGTTTAAPAASAPAETATAAVPAAAAEAATAAPRRGRPPKSATAEATGTTEAPAVEAPAAAKPAAARRSRSSAAGTTPEPATSASSAETSGEGATAPAATKRRTTRKATSEPSAE